MDVHTHTHTHNRRSSKGEEPEISKRQKRACWGPGVAVCVVEGPLLHVCEYTGDAERAPLSPVDFHSDVLRVNYGSAL